MDTRMPMSMPLDLYKPVPETSPSAMQSFCNDCAQKIHDGETIAARYGFRDKAHLRTWLLDHPAVFRKIEELRAVWESDDNVETRARKLAGLALIEAIPSHAQIMLDPNAAPGVRIDAFQATARVAGVSGPPAVPRETGGAQADPNGRFNVQIIFASSGRTESFTTREPAPVTIENEP